MSELRYADGSPLRVGDRVEVNEGQWRGVVEACGDDAAGTKERGVLVRYAEVGLVFYPDEIEADARLVARAGA